MLTLDLKIGALFARAVELGIWNFLPQFAAKLRRLYNFSRYDEVTAQAPGLADDRDRDSGDPVHFLFCATAGLRRDAGG